MHELGHKLKAENAQQWTAFQELVMDALDRNGVDVSELMQHEAEKFEQNGMQYDDDLLLEEVICNNAAGILQDEAVVRELIQKDRSLMERVADWLREFIDKMSRAMQDAGRDMSELGSWQGLQALKDDHESLKAIYESLMEGLESAVNQQEEKEIKYSPREGYTETGIAVYSSNFPEGTTRKERQDHILELVQTVWAKKPITLYIEKENETRKITARFDPTVDPSGNTYSDATKLAYGNRKGTMSDQKTTEKMADDFPELISNAKFVSEKAETGGKNEAHNGVTVWDYFANHIGFINEKGGYAEYNVYIDVKEKQEGHFVYSVAAEKIKGSEREKAPILYSDPKTILASVNGIKPAIAKSILLKNDEDVKYSLREDTEGNTLTEEQQEYFADSKVRSDDGKLLVMYHGTTAYGDINVFKPGKKGWLGPGIYLTNIRNDAKRYADAMGEGNGKLYELYANVTNPLYVYESDPVPEIMRAIYGSDRAYNTRAAKQANSPSMLTSTDIKKLKAKGYDGIIWKFYKSVEVSVFSPEQIKSVDNETPTVSPDIRFSLRETDDNIRSAVEAEEKAMMQGETLQKTNNDYERQEVVASRIAHAIDPKASSANESYSSDTWTPTFSPPCASLQSLIQYH